MKVNPFRRLLISTSNCACLFNILRDGISSSSSENGAIGVPQVKNRGNNGPPFIRIVLPSAVVVATEIVSDWKILLAEKTNHPRTYTNIL